MSVSSFQSHRGFTLLELLVGLSLSLMVMAAVLTTYVTLGRNFTRSLGVTSANEPNLESQARRTVASFTQDVRMASSIAGTPSDTSVTLVIPVGTSTRSIVYTYDSLNKKLYRGLLWNSATAYSQGDVVIYSNIAYLCVLAHTNQVPPNATYWTLARPLHANLLSFAFTYYDVSGNPYTSFTNYLEGIKQLSFTLTSQAGTNVNGTLTQIYRTDTPRLIIRNKALLQ